MNNYFSFNLSSDFFGQYNDPIDSLTVPSGTSKDPNDILKLNVGDDVWQQTPSSAYFSNIDLTITSLSSSDWSNEKKAEWLSSYLIHIGLDNKLTVDQFDELMLYSETINIFEDISSPSIAYVNRNDGTNGYIDPYDSYISNEVIIGLNVYKNNFIREYADSLNNNNPLKNTIYQYHKLGDVYISNCCLVEYNNYTEIVWAFDSILFDNYDISNLTIEPNLFNGGGNRFAEVKLGGNHLQARYKVKKNVSKYDPTVGNVSGEGKPFCMGDEIVIIDSSIWSDNNGTSGWTWVGDFSVLDYTWHISDVSRPCEYYANVPVYEQLFPLRIISFCKYENFN